MVGRPNSGKSTLLNTILGTKVSITSPRPQTTRSWVKAVYEDERGQIVFIDTPGIYLAAKDKASKEANLSAQQALKDVDVIAYIVDKTRKWGQEEAFLFHKIEFIEKPVIIALNKIDKRKPDYTSDFLFLEKYAAEFLKISAKSGQHVGSFLQAIFRHLPTGEKIEDLGSRPTPLIDMSSKKYLSELIREKVYLKLRQEIPYQVEVIVDDCLVDKEKNLIKITARLQVPNGRYKAMVIGKNGQKIKQIGMAVRQELEGVTQKKAVVLLSVDEEK